MSAVPERIGILMGRQGGFSSLNLPAPLAVQGDGSFLFYPQRTAGTWEVIGPGGITLPLSLENAGAGGSPSLRTTGGPYDGASIITLSANNIDEDSLLAWLEGTDSRYTPPAESEGITIESYYRIAPPSGSNAVAAEYWFGLLTTSLTAASPPSNKGLQVFVSHTGNGPAFIIASFGANEEFKVANNIGFPTASWRHVAAELYWSGLMRLYHDGEMVGELGMSAVAPGVVETLTTINPSYFRMDQGAPPKTVREYVEGHGFRYSPFIRYNGSSFDLPQVQ
jgi:hypothetical protein